MNTVACPFKPVVQRERLDPEPHVHRFELETMTDAQDIWVQDCTCGYRQYVRKVGLYVTDVLNDRPLGTTSYENSIFHTEGKGSWQDRWAVHS
jgi:hypothetical protein